MKKRAPTKKKSAAKPRAAKKSSSKAKKPAATPAPRVQAYTPQPIKSDGWAPFRYPLQ